MRAPAMAMAAAAGVLCAAGAAGCKKTLHWKTIEDEVQRKLGQEASITSVACDESAPIKGARFPCVMTFADGGTADLHVELIDDIGSWRMIEMYIPATRAATLIHDGLHNDNHVEAAVDCGANLIVGHHACTASNADGSIQMEFELTDTGGARWHPR
jgi:hypothetical protein